MKKLYKIMTACLILTTLTACTGKAGSRVEQTNSVDNVLKEMTGESQSITETQIQETTELAEETQESTEINTEKVQESTSADEKSEETTVANKEIAESNNSKPVDIDLTLMDKDMVYATVFQFMTTPSDYIGKTVKMKGIYNPNPYEGNYYHCVIIKDAAACCAQGLEFVWGDGSHVYPDDYPPEGTEVEVTGTFETYMEGEYMYCRLANAELIVS